MTALQPTNKLNYLSSALIEARGPGAFWVWEQGRKLGAFSTLLINRLQGVERRVFQGLVAAAQGKRERVENQIFRTQTAALYGEVMDALRHGQFTLNRQSHALFIDGQADERCAVPFGQAADVLGSFFSVFQVDGIDRAWAACACSLASPP